MGWGGNVGIKKRLGGALAAAALMMGVSLGAAAPASAAYTDCGGGNACFWANFNYDTGTEGWVYFANAIKDFGTVGTGFDNRTSSLYNHGNDCPIWVFQYRDYEGYQLYAAKGVKYGDLTTVKMGSDGANWNNKITSGAFYC